MTTGSAPTDELRIVTWPPTRADGAAMKQLFDSRDIASQLVSDVDEFLSALASTPGAVILSEEMMLSHARQLRAWIARQPLWSDLPVIVLSRAGSESAAFLQVAATLGNLTVVERPMRASTLVSQVRASLRARVRQYEMREYLLRQEHTQQALLEAEVRREQLLESERAARGEAERASRTKDEFLATLSHELRTPLNAVLGWTQVLRQSPGLPDDIAKGLVVIERNARAQAKIIGDLLDMSSIMSGKVRLEVSVCDLASLVQGTVETVRPALEAKGISLGLHLDGITRSLSGDVNRLQQIFWNLLTNAAKFTSRGGRVEVTAEEEASHVVVAVKDTGDGIDPAFLPHVFDRFRQADGSSTRSHGGLGLGLSIVKQLVELHGGSITAASVGRGQGATFRIVLPLHASAPLTDVRAPPEFDTEGPVVTPAVPQLNLQGVRFLVVDDEPDARDLLERLLSERGSVVTTASSAEVAFHALEQARPNVLISDIGMPGEDGYSLIRRIRARPDAGGGVAAIALTAYARGGDQKRAIESGFDRHLTKPVEPALLFGAIESLLNRQEARVGRVEG